MALQLTLDEMREVCLAIAAYRQALEQRNGSGVIDDAITCLDEARGKITREWKKQEGVDTKTAAS
jgi:hypothetical protein